MTPERYRALKKESKKFEDGEIVIGLSEFTGKVKWSRWETGPLEWSALVVNSQGEEKFFWHSELSACEPE